MADTSDTPRKKRRRAPSEPEQLPAPHPPQSMTMAEQLLYFESYTTPDMFKKQLQTYIADVPLSFVAAVCGANPGTFSNWIHRNQSVSDIRKEEWAKRWNNSIPLITQMRMRGVMFRSVKSISEFFMGCFNEGWPIESPVDLNKTFQEEIEELQADPLYRVMEYFDDVLGLEIEDYFNPHEVAPEILWEIVKEELLLEEVLAKVRT